MTRRHLLTWFLPALAVLIFCGLLNLPFPFVSDQVVALGGALQLSQGETLYVDFWDNKLPGLFWFYLAGCSLFGFSEIGIHGFELIWQCAFAIVMMWTLRRWLEFEWLAAIVPLVIIGTYYMAADSSHLTQLEMLVAFPIFGAAWLTSRRFDSRSRWSQANLAAGALAGITVTFKLVFAPLFVVFWLVASHAAWRRQAQTPAAIVRCIWLPASAGVVAVIGAVALYFLWKGALDELYWTAFVYPPQALDYAPSAVGHRLVESVMFFGSYFALWALFIGYALLRWWRGDRDTFTTLCIAWLIVCSVLIYIQRFSWWQYHFLLLFPPAGLLGVKGLSQFADRLVRGGSDLSAETVTALIAFPLVAALAVPAAQKVTIYKHVFYEEQRDAQRFQEVVRTEYYEIRRSTAFLRKRGSLPGRIYVFGTPLYYYLAGRQQAAPIGGWPWDYFLPEQWDALPAQLEASKPNYIFVETDDRLMMDRRPGDMWGWINERYIELLEDERGTWFVIKSDLWN